MGVHVFRSARTPHHTVCFRRHVGVLSVPFVEVLGETKRKFAHLTSQPTRPMLVVALFSVSLAQL